MNILTDVRISLPSYQIGEVAFPHVAKLMMMHIVIIDGTSTVVLWQSQSRYAEVFLVLSTIERLYPVLCRPISIDSIWSFLPPTRARSFGEMVKPARRDWSGRG